MSYAPKLFMVFDVESIGLHGEGFAVGWVVVDRDGVRLDSGLLACDPDSCHGTADGRDWVRANVAPLGGKFSKYQVCDLFWAQWLCWKANGAILVADCAWPVEANFLSSCVNRNHGEREWQGPYPLHDLASILLALGHDPRAVTPRLPDELPEHNPLNDARQSARQLVEALKSAPGAQNDNP